MTTAILHNLGLDVVLSNTIASRNGAPMFGAGSRSILRTSRCTMAFQGGNFVEPRMNRRCVAGC